MKSLHPYFEACHELTRQLVEIDSVTPNDKGCQALLAQRLEKLGFNIEWFNFSDEHGEVTNLWARRNTTPPCLVFAGHTDVVPIGNLEQWNSPPFTLDERNGNLYARGIADMKCSLAAFVCAIEAFLKQHPHHPGSIALLITSDEEGPATCGTKKVIEALEQRGEKFEYCLVGEPSSSKTIGDTIKNGRRGSLGGDLTIIGKQGHIAYPHLADNPIHYCGKALETLLSIQWDKGNDYFPPTSFQVSNIHSGTGVSNVIPANADIKFNFRFSTEVTAKEIQEKVESALNTLGINYQIRWTLYGLPFLTQPGKLIDACINSVSNTLGIKSTLSTSGGTSDGRFIAQTGAEVVELGPINQTIHQVNECLPKDSPHQLAKIYYGVLENILIK